MKTTTAIMGITMFFFVVILAWVGATSDIFRPPPVEDMQTIKQQAPIAKPSARQKKNCACCKQTMKKLKQVIEDNFAEKQAEKQVSVVNQTQR